MHREAEDRHLRAKKMREIIEEAEKGKGKSIRTNTEFAEFLVAKSKRKVDKQLVSNAERPDNPSGKFYSKKLLEWIEEEYGISRVWVMTGKGDMLVSESRQNVPVLMEESQAAYGSPELQRRGEAKLSYGNPNLQILIAYVDRATDEDLVRVVDEPAFASYSANFRDVQFIKQLKLETIPYDLKGKGTINKFFVYGESMEPSIKHGDHVYASFVERIMGRDPFKIRDSYIYVINSRQHGLMVKRLYHHVGSEYVDCISDNPDKKTHPNFSVHYNDIMELWYWRRTYTAHAPLPPEVETLEDIKRGLMVTTRALGEVAQTMKKIENGIQLALHLPPAI